MARDAATPVTWTEKIVTQAAPTMLAGLGAVGCSFVLSQVGSNLALLTALRVTLMVTGLMIAGTSIIIRYRHTRWEELESRLLTGAVLALGGLAALIGYWAMNEAWDTARLVLALLVAIALAGGGIVMLSQGLRRAIVSLLVLVHFGGILTAVTSEQTSNGASSWVSAQIRTRIYRPYLELIYQTNPYHFYSPDPGPPFLLWFYIEYEDDTVYKLEIPRREDFTTRLEYQRRLGLTDRATTGDLSAPTDEMGRLRKDAAFLYQPPLHPHPTLNAASQFRRSSRGAKRFLSSYVRHIEESYRSELDPSKTPRRVKIYCVIQNIITPLQLEYGMKPTDPAMFSPYYFGTYNREGKLEDPHDPMLYWMIPIYRKTKAGIDTRGREPRLEETEIVDGLEQHAVFSK